TLHGGGGPHGPRELTASSSRSGTLVGPQRDARRPVRPVGPSASLCAGPHTHRSSHGSRPDGPAPPPPHVPAPGPPPRTRAPRGPPPRARAFTGRRPPARRKAGTLRSTA